jgi:putative tricarboxylic transport membrane protein
MTRHDRYTSLIWGLLGLYIAFEGWHLQLGTVNQPKSGFVVFWAGMILFGLSMLLFLKALLTKKEDEAKALWKGRVWPKGVKVMAALFTYALIFRLAGFLISTFFLLLYLLKGLESQRWSVAIVITVVTIALCYLVFVVFLESQFPAGILGEIFS